STYENKAPVTASDPRIAAPIADDDTESDLPYAVSDDFQQPVRQLHADYAAPNLLQLVAKPSLKIEAVFPLHVLHGERVRGGPN
ncbi:MAG: hypothetical protein ACI89J_000512, partial [Hyphomicrobiaceae bacterium]